MSYSSTSAPTTMAPGQAHDNAFIETLNGSLRDGRLNLQWLKTIEEARRLIEAWRFGYNGGRPSMPLGNQTQQEMTCRPAI
jgi:putative transposase